MFKLLHAAASLCLVVVLYRLFVVAFFAAGYLVMRVFDVVLGVPQYD